MTELRPMPTPDLERMLAELRPHVAFPPQPDLAGSIRSQIAARSLDLDRARWDGWRSRPRQLAIGFVAFLAVLTGALVASPDLRTTVADRLGLDGIRIEFVDDEPAPATDPVGATLLLGEATTLAGAQASVPYVIQLPAALGAPDEVYLRQLSAGPMVSLLYRPRPDLPEAAETGVGAILMQFPASSHPADLSKRITAGMGTVVEIEFSDGTGYWVTGKSEFMIPNDPSQDFDDLIGRPSANVLLWESDGLTFRLETDLTQSDAVAIAESIAPGTDPAP